MVKKKMDCKHLKSCTSIILFSKPHILMSSVLSIGDRCCNGYCPILNCSCLANKLHVLELFNTIETIKDKRSNHNYSLRF